MLEDLSTAGIAYKALKLSIQKLNDTFHFDKEKGLEDRVEIKIIKSHLQRELLYKIDNNLPDEIKEAIKSAIIEEAKRLRINVITVS